MPCSRSSIASKRPHERGSIRSIQPRRHRRLAEHVGRVVSIVLESLNDDERTTTGLAIVQDVIDLLAARSPESLDDLRLTSPATLLSAVERQLPDGSYQSIDRPLTALRDSTLLVNAPGEPRVLHELIAEVPSAHTIDVLVAFVRLSGINPMLTALRRHLENGGRVRLLTTTYTNSTQVEALEALTNAGADVRVSYDQTTTRLHAKAWIFNRARGQSTAYVGSSNLTHSAMVPGLEWNVRLSSSRNPDVIAKMAAVFETYWASGDFEPFETDEFRERTARPENRSTSAHSPDRPDAAPVPGADAGAHRRRPRPRPPPEPAGRRNRHRQDGDGRRRLPQPRPGRFHGRACCSSPTAARSSNRAGSPTATRSTTHRSVSSGWARTGPATSSTSSHPFRASRRPASTPSTRPTSTSSSSTSSTTPLRRPTGHSSNDFNRGSCSA